MYKILLALLLVPFLLFSQNTVKYKVICLEKPDSMGFPFAERVIELNKRRNMLQSSYRFASDERKRNIITCQYDKKGRLTSKEEYAWSNYFLENFIYKKNEIIHEVKYNTINSTHHIFLKNGKRISEKVFLGMKSMEDSLTLKYEILYHYNEADSLDLLLFQRPGDTSWFEKKVRKFDGGRLVREETFSTTQQISYRELKYDEKGALIEEGFWDILHPANWEVYKYSYPDKNSKVVLRSNIYVEEWTLFQNQEIRLRKIFDITPEGVLMRQWEEYRME